jgi:hypothetical protein
MGELPRRLAGVRRSFPGIRKGRAAAEADKRSVLRALQHPVPLKVCGSPLRLSGPLVPDLRRPQSLDTASFRARRMTLDLEQRSFLAESIDSERRVDGRSQSIRLQPREETDCGATDRGGHAARPTPGEREDLRRRGATSRRAFAGQREGPASPAEEVGLFSGRGATPLRRVPLTGHPEEGEARRDSKEAPGSTRLILYSPIRPVKQVQPRGTC